MWLIRKVRPMYAKEDIPEVYLPGWEIFAIDSTTIPCSIKLAEWAALKNPLTITEISKVLGASLLMKIDIKELLNIPEPLTQNQNVNELKLDF